MARPSDALQGRRDRTRRLDQHDLVEASDIDAQFERVRGNDGPELAFL
jgi:hypothetical protein